MVKQISRRMAVVLAMVMLMTSFAFTMPVNAAAKADMKKANVKWDLKNNKKLTYKQYWYSMGAKKHTVKMTKFKIKNAKKKGYKQCTFTLTYNMKVNPTKKQVYKMSNKAGNYTQWYFTVVDYNTGKSLEAANDKNVTVTSDSKYYYSKKIKGTNKSWIKYPKKWVAKVTIIYPEDYKDLAIGVGGCPNLKSFNAHFNGEKSFSKTSLYSKKDKSFAHFMRVK